MKRKIPTEDELNAFRINLKLDCKSRSGLVWGDVKPWGRVFPGSEAFTTLGTGGYYNGMLDGKRWLSHNIVWFLRYGEWPSQDELIDHEDGDKLNNEISNLRKLSSSRNNHNREMRGYTTLKSGSYRVRMQQMGKVVFEKIVKTEEEAIDLVRNLKLLYRPYIHDKFIH